MTARLLPDIELDPSLVTEIERFERNAKYAEEKWTELVQAHPRMWLAVYDEQKTMVDRDLHRLIERIPEESHTSAKIAYLDPDPPILIL